MKIILKVNKVWDVIDQGVIDETKNDMAIGLLFESIPETLVLQVGNLDTTKEVWEAIKTRHLGAERVKEARLQTLMAEFDRIKMKDTEKIDDFVGKLSEIASKAAELGVEIDDPKMVKKFMSSLPRKKYIHIVASLEQVLDLNKTSFEDIIGRIKTYEERVSEEEETHEEQSKLLYANSDQRQDQYNRSEGGDTRGRGGRFPNRGRGRGRSNGTKDLSEVECYRCDKFGHYASSCPDRLLKLQEAQINDDQTETHEADELMMHEVVCINTGNTKKNEVVYLNEKNVNPKDFEDSDIKDDIWYLDNGASNHMSGNPTYFQMIDTSVTGKVRFGDDSRIDIKGKGTIMFISNDGSRKIIADVYYIPDLKSNIISLGQATEFGCEIVMKGNTLTLHDKNGNLIAKAIRSRNRLYKVIMKKTKPGSKAYRLFDPTTQKVVVSRNVVFDENTSWKWDNEDQDEQVEVQHVSGNEQKADILTKALARIKFREMREFIGIQDLSKVDFKIRGENVDINLK